VISGDSVLFIKDYSRVTTVKQRGRLFRHPTSQVNVKILLQYFTRYILSDMCNYWTWYEHGIHRFSINF